jgi:hypothetical protein
MPKKNHKATSDSKALRKTAILKELDDAREALGTANLVLRESVNQLSSTNFRDYGEALEKVHQAYRKVCMEWVWWKESRERLSRIDPDMSSEFSTSFAHRQYMIE